MGTVARNLDTLLSQGEQQRQQVQRLTRELQAAQSAHAQAEQQATQRAQEIERKKGEPDSLARNLRLLGPDGRLVCIGLQGGSRAELDLSMLLSRRIQVIGSTLRPLPLQRKAALIAANRAAISSRIVGRRIAAILGEKYA